MAEEETKEISPRDLGKSYFLHTGHTHPFQIRRYQGHVLEVEDTNFHHNSAVLLPDYETGDSEQDRITGLTILQACYEHAEAHPDQKLLVIGHADRSGAANYNLELSRLRARGVLYALMGQRSDWVGIAEQKHKVEDYQRIVRWAAGAKGWDCDPGAVDNREGPATRRAVKEFQKAYNQEFGASIAEDGAVGRQTWEAIFDVYMSELGEIMGTDESGLAEARGKLKFLDGGRKSVGCGENFPITPDRAENYRSPVDRRVEILFFDPGEEPELNCHPSATSCRPEECEIYDPRYYGFRPVPVRPRTRVVIGARLHANFDRQEGGQNVDSADDSRRGPRLLRPGAIILPNLDIDEASGSPRTRFRATEADALVDRRVNPAGDAEDLTLFEVKEPVPVVGNAVRIVMQVDPRDARRVRVLQIPEGRPETEAVERIGPARGNRHTLADVRGGRRRPPEGWQQRFIVEARTLAGDPSLPPSGDKAPPPPGAQRAPVPETSGGSQLSPAVNATDTSLSSYDSEAARNSGDVWVELIQENASGPSAELRDVGLFTIAPWIMTDNTCDCLRIYVANLSGGGTMNPPPGGFDSRYENHCMLWDLKAGCHAAGLGPAPDPDTTLRIPSSRRSEIHQPDDVPFYVVEGSLIDEDRWVQDEFEVGYCFAPHQWLHVVLHNKRSAHGSSLAKFVDRHMAHPGLGVFNGIAGNAPDAIDFGGNLEVSPPVRVATPAQDRGAGPELAGPSCNEHDRPAPFGKIITGDCTPRPASPDYHQFLQAQRVQPVLPLDTSWLLVGHVDEFMSFVRANNPRGFCLLLAQADAMTKLLEAVHTEDPVATMHAGKYVSVRRNRRYVWRYDEEFVEDWLTGLNGVKRYSEDIDRLRMDPIRTRLMEGLDLDDLVVLPIPTYFTPPPDDTQPLGSRNNQTIAHNVGMVNMQVVNEHLMVPRPFGPRLEEGKARTCVESILQDIFGINAPPVQMPSPDEHFFWARPGETLRHLAMYFARPSGADDSLVQAERRKIIDKLKADSTDLTGLDPAYVSAIEALEDEILNDPLNQGAPTPIGTVARAPRHKFRRWMRVHIPGNTVDVIEAYMLSVLGEIGNTVHFIDDFECYHAMMGEVHCGTNARRKPRELTASFTARWWDSGVYDPDYDTDFDPAS